MIIQNEPETEGARADMSFTVPRDDLRAARAALEPLVDELGIAASPTDEAMGKVSIVGAGMKTHPGVAAKVFTTLGDHDINIEMISTSPIKISCVVPGDRVPDAVRALHAAFEPGAEGTIRPEQPFGEFAHEGTRRRRRRHRRRRERSCSTLLRERGLPATRSCRSPPSARPASELDGDATIQPLREDTIEGFDLALFSAGGGTSREWAPRFAEAGAVVVDNSSAWRMDDDVPLVVSEVNPDALDHIGKGIVANPNCTTMAVMLPAKALHDAFGLRAMVCTTFQAAGGAGQKGIDELADRSTPSRAPATLVNDGAAAARSRGSTPTRWPSTSCPGWAATASDGYTDEEMKLSNESRKILDLPDLAVSPTCVRVPVMVGHAIEVRATFERHR